MKACWQNPRCVMFQDQIFHIMTKLKWSLKARKRLNRSCSIHSRFQTIAGKTSRDWLFLSRMFQSVRTLQTPHKFCCVLGGKATCNEFNCVRSSKESTSHDKTSWSLWCLPVTAGLALFKVQTNGRLWPLFLGKTARAIQTSQAVHSLRKKFESKPKRLSEQFHYIIALLPL